MNSGEMIWKLLLLSCFVLVSFALPLDSTHKSRSRQKRSFLSAWDPYMDNYNRMSRLDNFNKYDLNGDTLLDLPELAYMFYDKGLPVDEAIMFANQQFRHDIDKNDGLDRWEFLRNSEMPDWMWDS